MLTEKESGANEEMLTLVWVVLLSGHSAAQMENEKISHHHRTALSSAQFSPHGLSTN
jgi:hypothetical protein